MEGGDGGGSGSGRRGRNASRSNRAKSKLSNLMALREKGPGAKRAEDFKLKKEEAIFDVVDDLEYTAIVAERRNKYGDFVVEDGGTGYVDIGEEDDWNVDYYKDEREREEREERDLEAANSKKRKDGRPADASAKGKQKKKSKNQQSTLLSDALNQNKKLDKMFLAATAAGPKKGGISLGQAAAKTSVTAKRMEEKADDLLEDILGDLDTNVDPGHIEPRAPATKSRPFARQRPAQTQARPRQAPPRPMASKRPRQAPAEEDAMLRDLDSPMVAEEDDIHPEGADTEMAPANPVSPEPAQGAPRKPSVRFADPVEEAEDAANQAIGGGGGSGGRKVEMEEQNEGKSAWEAMCDADVHLDLLTGEETMAMDPNADAAAGVTPIHDSEENVSEDFLDFYFVDLHSENGWGAQRGVIYLFGKVAEKSTGPNGKPITKWQSCSVVVRNMQRNLYFVPKPHLLGSNDVRERIDELEQKIAAAGNGTNGANEGSEGNPRGDLMKVLHEKFADLKREIRSILNSQGVSNFTLVPVKRSYAFEKQEVPRGAQWVIKVKYAASLPEINVQKAMEDASAAEDRSFCAILGAKTTISEHLILKRKLKGPGWLRISNPRAVPQHSQITWSKREYEVDSPKKVSVREGSSTPPHPPLTVAAVNIKTHVAANQTKPEIMSVTVMYLTKVQTDLPTPKEEWNTLRHLRHFSCVRRLDGQEECKQRNQSKIGKLNGGSIVSHFNSERALLSTAVARLRDVDPDCIVGHNVLAYDLDILYSRMIALKVPHWSRLGRIKKSQPLHTGSTATKTKSAFGGGGWIGSAVTTGRLVCDTYLSSKEFVRQADYSLKSLSRELLGIEKKQDARMDISKHFDDSSALFQLISLAEQDAWLSLGLMFHLSVLPLTRQLTNLSGFQWAKVLRGGRAQRIEYLLLHEFHRKKFIVPDDPKREKKSSDHASGGSRRQKAKYAGGLVLEPKAGLYEDVVLMLDYNSLYPSIIQEYNVCWTTMCVATEETGEAQERVLGPTDSLKGSHEGLAVLPAAIRSLVERRREVKRMMKSAKSPAERQQLDIRQQALKLTANSTYGCLGFAGSRFCAQNLAEFVTQQGREILQSTVTMAEQEVGLDVVYGDTDSIFVLTKEREIARAVAIGRELAVKVNKKFSCLTIEIDAIFKKLLLLKKKKYAALKPDGEMEVKGLDLVRRDWSVIAKRVGRQCLSILLSDKQSSNLNDSPSKSELSEEPETPELVKTLLSGVAEDVRNGKRPMEDFIIHRALTKAPEAYPDGKSQPHVQVALRRQKRGARDGCNAGETVTFVVTTAEGPLADKARGLDEVKLEDIDLQYYLAQQIMPVVGRLTACVPGLEPAMVAQALGLDATKYHQQAAAMAGQNHWEEKEEAMLGWKPKFELPEGLDSVGAGAVTMAQKRNLLRLRIHEEVSAACDASHRSLGSHRSIGNDFQDGPSSAMRDHSSKILYDKLRSWAHHLKGDPSAKRIVDDALDKSDFGYVPKSFWTQIQA